MPRRGRIAIFCALAALGLAGALLITLTDDPPPAETPTTATEASAPDRAEPTPTTAPGLREASGAHREDHGVGEVPPAVKVVEASRAGRPEVSPVVDRFLAAFSAYELGRFDSEVRTEIDATTTPAFGRELLEAPPRLPLGGPKPPRAEIRKVEIYLAPDAPEGTATALIERDGELARTTYLLVRIDRAWRISGVL